MTTLPPPGRLFSVTLAGVILLLAPALCRGAEERAGRLRLIVETDAGGDPDDEQSLVRFLLYANEWDVEGVIANRPTARDKENLNPERTGLGIVRRLVRAYGECYPNLVRHDPRYPKPGLLQERTVAGYEDSDDGVRLVLRAVDADDPRPVWFLNWGTDHGAAPSCLRRALDRVLKERGPKGYAAFKSRLRVIGYPHLFGDHATMTNPPFPLFVDTFRPPLEGKRWYHRFSALTAKAGGFDLKRDVLTGHGPLGALYPTNTTHPQKEGDTPTFLYLVPTGMNDPDQPTWGSWAGRYGLNADAKGHPYFWANQADAWRGTTHRDNTLARWAADLQNDFRARLDWCVKSVKEANHPPAVVVNGDTGKKVLRLSATPGTTVRLSAKGTADPDGDTLSYGWFVYPEPGTYRGEVRLAGADSTEVQVTLPDDAAGKTIHLVLAVKDHGTPALTRYRRVVLTGSAPEAPKSRRLLRLGAAQTKNRTIDFRLRPADALKRVDQTLEELERLVDRAGALGCDALAFPEDTLGLLKWVAANPGSLKEVLPEAVRRMLDRLGRAAARHCLYLVCCNDFLDAEGHLRNTAFFLGRDGKEIGRYFKVQPTFHEARKRGDRFPVFPTPDLGAVGLLICYDMVFPEAPRALALSGADVIFHPTLGGAAIGDGDISRAAFRTRAVENFVYLVVAQRGGGTMIVSPQGKVLAEGKGPDDIAFADVDPAGGREGGDAFNHQKDMRARLFRERNPAAYGILTDPDPPALKALPADITPEEAARIAAKGLTVGQEEFDAAAALARAGKTQAAIAAFERLRAEYRSTWIDRVAQQRLQALRASAGIAAGYPGDRGIAGDPRVVFAEDFETGDLDQLTKRWTEISNKGGKPIAFHADAPPGSGGKRCLQVTATPPENTGGHLYKRLPKGYEKLHLRFYVKFAEGAGYTHHFVTLGGHNPPSSWPSPRAGERPRGDDRIYIGIEPHGNGGRADPPGAWNFYSYWHEMKRSADGRYWGNAVSPEAPLQVPRGRWQCVEVMVKLESAVGKADGELALWLDGAKVMHVAQGTRRGPWSGMGFTLPKAGGEPFEGFRWRGSPDLRLNFLWLLHYVTEEAARRNKQADPRRPNRVWFDDVVVATEYIGPIAPGKTSGR